MELLAIRTARFVGIVSTEELNPNGLLIYPSLIEGLVEKYNFLIAPGEDDELDEVKGINFEDGAWGNIALDKVTIYSNGIIINTRSTTKDSEAIFYEALQWASESFGITFKPEMVSRKLYFSEIIFRSEAPLNNLNPSLQAFTEKISRTFHSYTGKEVKHELSGVSFHYDASDMVAPVTPFRIERLEATPYSENKYYSIAPLPTDEHIKMVKEFEQILS